MRSKGVAVYLDYNATTPVRAEVLEAMLPFFGDSFGNPSSIHRYGQEARAAVDEARAQVAGALAAETAEIYFTSGGTESDNWAIRGIAYGNRERGNHIVTSQVEHHAVLNTCRQLEREGFAVTYLGVDATGMVDPDQVARAVTDKTILISIMHANNEVGTLQPIEAIGRIARARAIYFHVDAVQSVGKLPLDVNRLQVDLLSLSGHKIYAPKGIGVLYVRRGTRFVPWIYGGEQEGKRRAGTENTPAIVGLGKALSLATAELESTRAHLSELRQYLWARIQAEIPEVRLNGHPSAGAANTLNVSFAGAEGEALVLSLDLEGIAVSSGSACTSGTLQPSHVLLAMGLSPEQAQSSLRISFGRDSSSADVDYLMAHLPAIVARLRALSVGVR